MLLVPTIIRCCAHIVRLVCGQTEGRTDKPSTVTLAAHARRGLLVECLALWASGSGPEAPALLLVETDTYTSCSSYICEMPVLDAIQCMTFKPFL